MTIRIEQSTGQRITQSELSMRGYSVSDDSDISEWGFPTLALTARPDADPGMQVEEGQDEEYEPGQWRQTWEQVPIPPDPIPQQVTRAQAKAVLIQMGLWSAVLSWVASIEDDTQRALAEVAINDTLTWERDSPMLSAAAQALNLTDEQMDAMFVSAAQVRL